MTQTAQPMKFDTRTEAEAWCATNGHYGMITESFGGSRTPSGRRSGWIIAQRHNGVLYAVASTESLVLLSGW